MIISYMFFFNIILTSVDYFYFDIQLILQVCYTINYTSLFYCLSGFLV